MFEIIECFAGHEARGDGSDGAVCRLGHERHGAAGARVNLNKVYLTILDRELDVAKATYLKGEGELHGLLLDLFDDVGRERVRRQA